jgi:hypothetical protein
VILIERVVSYHYTMGNLLRTRRQSDGLSSQSCPRRVLRHLLPKTIELDIENCMFSILQQLIKLLEVRMPADLQETLDMCAEQRDVVCRTHLRTSVAEGYPAVIFASTHLQHNGFIRLLMCSPI